MRKVILNLAVSLDGYIEGPNGEYDWCFSPPKKEMEDFMTRIDTIFLGRNCFEFVGGGTFPGKKSYVFSNTLKETGKKYTLVSGEIEHQVKEIKEQKGGDIWLFGGAGLTTSFLNLGLIDEISLAVHPILLGEGKFLFQKIRNRVHLTLSKTISYPNGLVILTYQVKSTS